MFFVIVWVVWISLLSWLSEGVFLEIEIEILLVNVVVVVFYFSLRWFRFFCLSMSFIMGIRCVVVTMGVFGVWIFCVVFLWFVRVVELESDWVFFVVTLASAFILVLFARNTCGLRFVM